MRLEKPHFIFNFALVSPILIPSITKDYINPLNAGQALLVFVDMHNMPSCMPHQLNKLMLLQQNLMMQLKKLLLRPKHIQLSKLIEYQLL